MKLYLLALCALVGLTACRQKEQKPEYKVNVQVKEVSDTDVPQAPIVDTKQVAAPQQNTSADETFEALEVPMPEEDDETVLESLSIDEEVSVSDDDAEELDTDTASIVT
jgi:hypothetical protein